MRTRRSQSSGNPVSPFDGAHGKPFDKAHGKSTPEVHTPVLLHEVLEMLDIRKNDVVLDATLGGGGHARALLDKLGPKGMFIGFDLDEDAILRSRKVLIDTKPKIHLIQANFRNLSSELQKLGIPNTTKALFDLGWSSYQLDSGRGFSFSAQGRSASGGLDQLLMTYAKHPSPNAVTASVIVNEWAEESIADVIYGWGQERYSRRIARAIVARRKVRPFSTASELAETVRSAIPSPARRGKMHPATKTFQALRIAVNDELGALTEGVKAAWERLTPGGRIAVIAFHSIEDGVVKRLFAEFEKSGQGVRLTKKPLTPTEREVKENPRSRSAKLRVIEKSK